MVGSRHRKQYMMADAVTAGGALRLPYISGPVPVKSNSADPSTLSMCTVSLMGVPSSRKSSAVTESFSFIPSWREKDLSISLTELSAQL